MSNKVQNPYPLFADRSGAPLANGYIYIGESGLNPIANPISIYWDSEYTIPADQPIRTINGYPSRNGTPSKFYTNVDYSIIIQDRNQSLVFSSLSKNAGSTSYDVNVKDFGAYGDGVTNDTDAIQAACDYAATINYGTIIFGANEGGRTINKPHATVIFPTGEYLIDSISVVPGVMLDGKNSVFQANSADVDMFYIAGYTGTPFYSGMKCGARDMFINGNDIARSGMRISTVNWGNYTNIITQFCRIGMGLEEVQYSTFINCYSSNNTCGWLLTCREAAKTLVTIDNTFIGCTADWNTKYGWWLQSSTNNTWHKVDASTNEVCNVVIGPEIRGYVTALTVTNGGSAYETDAVLPVTFAGDGSGAIGYAITNSSGVVTAAYMTESGHNYTSAPTGTVTSATGSNAAFTATVDTDIGLGYFDGDATFAREKNVFYGLKSEWSRNTRPKSGYSIWNRAPFSGFAKYRNQVFDSPTFFRLATPTTSPDVLTSYAKYFRSDVEAGVIATNISTTEMIKDITDPLYNTIELNPTINPAVQATPGTFDNFSTLKSTVNGGMYVTFTGYSAPANCSYQELANDENNATIVGLKCAMTFPTPLNGGGATYGGLASTHFAANVETNGVPVFGARVYADDYERFIIQNTGYIGWGDGSGATDTFLQRGGAGLLYTASQFTAVDGIRLKTKAGSFTDADFNVDSSGIIALDTTGTGTLYVRVGSTWRTVALT